MKFWRRFRLYLIGFALGCIVVYFLFKDRELPAWLPEGRVLEHMQKIDITYSDKADCMMNCLEISTDSLKKMLPEGDVKFGESETRAEPCPYYWIELGSRTSEKLKIYVEVCEKRATVEQVEAGRDCGC